MQANAPLLDLTETARIEGEKELRFRKRVLYFCAALPLFEIVAIVCLLTVADVVPVDVQTISYWLIIVKAINALTLNMGWFAIRKRGTGRHRLYALLGMTITGVVTMVGNDWYIFNLTSHQGRIEAICSLARQSSNPGISCHAQWLALTLIMTIFLALLGAANVTMLLFAFKIISHGHKRKVAMVQSGQEETPEYKLW